MLFNLCLAIITITAHASPHYITVWIHFAARYFAKTLNSTPIIWDRQLAGRQRMENNMENFVVDDLRLWEKSACDSLWVLVKLFWTSGHGALFWPHGKYGKKQIPSSYCCLTVSGVFISAALQHAIDGSVMHVEMNSKGSWQCDLKTGGVAGNNGFTIGAVWIYTYRQICATFFTKHSGLCATACV